MTKNEEGIIRQNVRLARDQIEQLLIESQLNNIPPAEVAHICKGVPLRNKKSQKYFDKLAMFYEQNREPTISTETKHFQKKKPRAEMQIDRIVQDKIAVVIYEQHQKGKRYIDISSETGVNKQTITEVMQSTGRPPSLSTVVRFAKHYDISVDWFCGFSNSRETDRTSEPGTEFSEIAKTVEMRIQALMEQSGMTNKDIAKFTMIDEHTISNLKKSRKMPPALSTVARFALGMNVSMEWLCGFKEV